MIEHLLRILCILQCMPTEPLSVNSAEAQRCMAETIYFEARNGGDVSMISVGMVVLNRLKHEKYPNTICKVVRQGIYDSYGNPRRGKCQFSYFCDGKPEFTPTNNSKEELYAWKRAQHLSDLIIRKKLYDLTNGSTHYHASYISPNWAYRMKPQVYIGGHIFYKE